MKNISFPHPHPHPHPLLNITVFPPINFGRIRYKSRKNANLIQGSRGRLKEPLYHLPFYGIRLNFRLSFNFRNRYI